MARRFLESNFETPMQKLVSDWLMAGAVVLLHDMMIF